MGTKPTYEELEQRVRDLERIEASLRESEARYRSFVSNFQGIAFRGYKDFSVDFMHGAVEAITGYREDEFKDGSVRWLDLVHEEDKRWFLDDVDRVNDLKEPADSRVYRIVRKDGETRWLKDHFQMLYDETGAMQGVEGVMFDITDIKRAEEVSHRMEQQLGQAEKILALATLASGMAHDIGTNLAGMAWVCELALADEIASTKQRHCWDQISKYIEQTRTLVEQITTFSRRGRHKKHLVSVTAMVGEVLDLLRSRIPETLEVHSELETDTEVLANPSHVHRILMNLCTNAHQAMESGVGCLTVRVRDTVWTETEETVAGDLPPGRYVQVTVQDTGVGMDEATQRRAFEPYFTTKTLPNGTGLGLSVVHGLVTECNGRISVLSTPGQGATFTILLPAAETGI